MAIILCMAAIRPASATTTEVNVRAGPGMNHDVLMKASVGISGLLVIDARQDEDGSGERGRVYQWLRLVFPDNTLGWVRDDLVEIQGDCATFGYEVIQFPVRASTQTRSLATDAERTADSAAQDDELRKPRHSVPLQPIGDERIRKAAFNIAAGFEGSYDSYQTQDSGVICYGRFQFSLMGGSLAAVVERYLASANTPAAVNLRQSYLLRLHNRDASLRGDAQLKRLLQDAAAEQAMRDAQDQVATEHHWTPAQLHLIQPRSIQTPLGQALLFDMSIQHGMKGANELIGLAEGALGIPAMSRAGDTVDEQTLVAQIAEVRRDRLRTLAAARSQSGLKPRGDFWVKLIKAGDWQLQGDADGNVTLTPGCAVQVKNP